MDLRFIIALSVFFVFIFCRPSYPETTQYFDSEGNSISSRKQPSSQHFGMQRNYIPEGIDLQKDVRYEFYPVFGKTFSEVVRSAEENAPVDLRNKKRLPTKSEWTVGWSYKLAYSHGIDEEEKTVHVSLEIYDFSISYNIKIILPALIDDTVLNSAEKALWKNYYLRLVEFEHDHVKIIRDNDSREELQKKFDDLSYVIFDYSPDTDIQKTVETFIEKETEKTGSAWVKNLKKRCDEYDRTTEFGLALQKREAFFSKKEK